MAISVWTMLQVVFNLVVFASLAMLWSRLRRPPQDDPRLSRGLQLLQTKITVLEDLSDRTDSQVKQLTGLLDHKTRVLQNKVLEAEQQVIKIEHSMSKSMEVAEIFQDKIPHQEILERRQKVEYVKAARMAHSGLSVDEIAESVCLPREQIELIAKFNRDQLMFDEEALPEWAARGAQKDEESFSLGDMDFVANLEGPKHDVEQMARLESDFKQAVKQAQAKEAEPPSPPPLPPNVISASAAPAVMSLKATAKTLKEHLVSTAEDILRSQSSEPSTVKDVDQATAKAKLQAVQVKKVVFPRIER
ncbi:MAG: DUF2802 domain-containing protein [Bdellovibrionales bacterium]